MHINYYLWGILVCPSSDILLEKLERGRVMILWHVQKLYIEDGSKFAVIPYQYNFMENIKLESSYKATIRFLWSSRLSERAADKLCIKKNKKLQTGHAQR